MLSSKDSVGMVIGIGEVTAAKLAQLGISTIGDLCKENCNRDTVLKHAASKLDKHVIRYMTSNCEPILLLDGTISSVDGITTSDLDKCRAGVEDKRNKVRRNMNGFVKKVAEEEKATDLTPSTILQMIGALNRNMRVQMVEKIDRQGKGGSGTVRVYADDKADLGVVLKFVRLRGNNNTARALLEKSNALGLQQIFPQWKKFHFFTNVAVQVQPVYDHTMVHVAEEPNLDTRFQVVLAMLKSLLPKLTAMYTQGIYHRDIKPANIMANKDFASTTGLSNFSLIDFDCITRADEITAPCASNLYVDINQINAVANSFMDTTNLLERGNQLLCADLFALGITIMEIVFGKHPMMIEGGNYTAPPSIFAGESMGYILTASMQTAQFKAKLNMLANTLNPAIRELVCTLISPQEYTDVNLRLRLVKHLTECHKELK